MRILLAVALCFAIPATAGERYLGAIVSAGGADTTNGTTTTKFKVASGEKLTFNCTAAANICVDTATACTVLGGANPGVPVNASTNFPTSTKQDGAVVDSSGTAAKGGAILRIVGAGAVTCYVWARNGNE